MRFDKYDLLESERDPEGSPGRIGDSCANTSRWMHLQLKVNKLCKNPQRLDHFLTPVGFIRHPMSPWRENDFPTDQGLPLYIAFDVTGNYASCRHMKEHIKKNNHTMDGHNIISPIMWALINEKFGWLKFFLRAQAWIFKLPWRWNDEKKWFERSSDSTCDYLNWFHAALYVPEALRYVPKDTLRAKIQAYFLPKEKPEPNGWWLVELYHQAIDQFYPGN